MKAEVKPGRYVVAVSGGVDSMTLLHLLAQKRQSPVASRQSLGTDDKRLVTDDLSSLELIVAHFNHGIRPDAELDEELVARTAKKYGLKLEVGHGHLGAAASEAAARTARYKFLQAVMDKYQANAIITAHHQDDLLETAVINLIRGTGRKGMSAIMANPRVLRPLINVSKAAIISYAKANKLAWREDVTNRDERYLRNYIRRRVIPKMTVAQRRQLLAAVKYLAAENQRIDRLVEGLAGQIMPAGRLDRRLFTALPAGVANELVAYWLRRQGLSQLDRRKINRLSLLIKTAKPGTQHPVADGLALVVERREAYFAE